MFSMDRIQAMASPPSSHETPTLGAFSMGTPTLTPLAMSLNSSSVDVVHPHVQPHHHHQHVHAHPKRSPQLSPLFQSPVFSLNTPNIDYTLSHHSESTDLPRPSPLRSHSLAKPSSFMDSPVSTPMGTASRSVSLDTAFGLGEERQNSSVLERFKKFFEHQRNDPSVTDDAGGNHHHQDDAHHAAAASDAHRHASLQPLSVSSAFDTKYVPHEMVHNAPAPPEPEHSSGSSGSSDLFGHPACRDDAEMAATPISRQGSSCHQCKSRRGHEDLSFCIPSTPQKRKGCRKKYCSACLSKFYSQRPPRNKIGKQMPWMCPSCDGLCCCAACRRSKEKKENEIRRQGLETAHCLSPATSMAVGIVYFGEAFDSEAPFSIKDAVDKARQMLTHNNPTNDTTNDTTKEAEGDSSSNSPLWRTQAEPPLKRCKTSSSATSCSTR